MSLDEHRAQRADQTRQDTYTPADRDHALQHLYTLLASFGATQLDQLDAAGQGACHDCHRETHARWTIGRLDVCRGCAHHRLRAARHATAHAKPAEPGGPPADGFYHLLIHWTKTCHLEITEHELRGKLNSYRLTTGTREKPGRHLLSNDQKRTLIRLHRHLRDHAEHGGDQRPTDLEAWVRGHADRYTLTELDRQLDTWHIPAADRHVLADQLADRRRALGLTEETA